MNECQRPKQIHLIDSLLYCLEKWRWIVASMLIIAVMSGANTYWSTVKENRAIQNTQQAAVETETAYTQDNMGETDGQQSIDPYERAVEEMERDLDIQEDYLECSVVMKLDPYHISTGILNCYVEGTEHIESIIAAYNGFISSGRMAEALYAQDAYVPVEDLRYLISFSNTASESSGEGAVFQIQIKMPNSGLSEIYLERAEEIIGEYTSELRTTVAEHRVTVLSSVQSEMADLDMQKYQSTVRTTYLTSVRNLQALYAEVKSVQNAQQEEQSVNTTPVVTVSLKDPAALAKQSAIKGLRTGALVAFAVLFIFYLFGERLQSLENFDREFGMPLLSVVRLSEIKRKKFGFIDSLIFRLRGGFYGRIGVDEQIKIAESNVQAVIPKNSKGEAPAKIMLAGTASEKDVQALCTKLISEIETTSISPYRQLVFQSSAISELGTCDGVVFVEKRGSSHCEFIEQERRLVLDRGVQVLGMIVVC